jgi:hypothetical protein
MVDPITDMPAGTLGFRLSGRVTKDEYFRIVDTIRARVAGAGASPATS